jgi:hypothetical protein
MKGHLPKILRLVLYKPLLRLILLAFAITAGVAAAQAGEPWQIDSGHSYARLSLGAGSNALEIGVARVSGDVVFDANDPVDPVVNLRIAPENDTGADHATISFSSKRSMITADGKLAVTGELTVTRIERSATMEPNEAYSGPQYGDSVTRTESRQATLVFSDPGQNPVHNGVMRFVGNTYVSREHFPQLLDALTLDDWPPQLVNDEKCAAPSTIGEDYHGVKCTGTVIASVRNAVVPTGAPSGEGFYGFQPVVTPNPERAMIALDLELDRTLSSGPTANAATK